MSDHRDIYQKPESEPKKEGDLPRHDLTPADFRARSMRNTVTFSAIMLVLLGIATWIISFQDSKNELPVPEESPSENPMLTTSVPLVMSNLTPASLSIPNTLEPPSAEDAAEVDPEKMAQAMGETRIANDYLMARDLEKAEIHARKALEIWPNMNAAVRMLGVVHTQRGQFDQAILELEKALKNDPFSAETYNNLATAYMQKGQMEKAEELLNASLQISPDYRVAFLNLGLLNLARGRYDAAADYLGRAIEQAPNDPSPRNNLAVALMRIGRYDEARKHLRFLIDLNPGVPNWYFNLAITYVLENNFPEAMNWVRRGAQLCSPITCQKFLSDNDFNPMREYPDFKKLVESLSPNIIPPPPQG
jgi:Flp pilus assembly protein TadD